MSDPVSRDLRPRAPVEKVTVYSIHKRHKYHSITTCKFILGKEGVVARVVTLHQYNGNACEECDILSQLSLMTMAMVQLSNCDQLPKQGSRVPLVNHVLWLAVAIGPIFPSAPCVFATVSAIVM
jgi:hypothetical protein